MDVKKVQGWLDGAWESQIVRTSVKLAIFDHLPAEIATLCQMIPANLEGLSSLLQALVGLGLVEKTGETWGNSSSGAMFRRDAEMPYWAWVMHHEKLHRTWSRLEDFVKNGKEGIPLLPQDPQDHASFIGTMDILGFDRAESFWKTVKCQARHLLDLGGGGGRYSAIALQLFPERFQEVTVFDDPRSYDWYCRIKTELDPQKQSKFHFKSGNFLTDPLGESYDLILASNIFHIFDSSTSEIIMKAVRKALNPTGKLLVQDWFFEETIHHMPAVFNLNMLLNTPNGRVHHRKEFLELAERNGFKLETWIPLERDSKAIIFQAS